jgi:hypothetical protein
MYRALIWFDSCVAALFNELCRRGHEDIPDVDQDIPDVEESELYMAGRRLIASSNPTPAR